MSEDQGTPQPEQPEKSVLEIVPADLAPEAPAPPTPPPAPTWGAPPLPVPVAAPDPGPVLSESAPPAPVLPPTPPLESARWYTTVGGQVYGPYRAGDLRQFLQTGHLTWDTMVSRGEGDAWRPLHQVAEFNASPSYGPPLGSVGAPGSKERTVAGILALVLGSFGAHHWYLGNYLLAALYVVFLWTCIPALLGIVEGIIYLTAPEDRFQRNYKRWFLSGP